MTGDRILSMFVFFAFTPAYWELQTEERRAWQEKILAMLDSSQVHYDLYQVFPLQAEVDFLLWCSTPLSENMDPAQFFFTINGLLTPHRHLVVPKLIWWGMTRPSDYARGKSAQEIDPFDGNRSRYLVVYPFSKTAEWYKLSRDTRQGMMNEHIRTGHQYPQIRQLLLYSTGLQDQEFIVTYETDDLGQFSTLVTDLRGSEARRYTLLDTPVFTAVYRSARENFAQFI